MKKNTLFYILLLSFLGANVVAKEAAQTTDSLKKHDVFFEQIEPSIKMSRDKILSVDLHKNFWRSFNEKFGNDYDLATQYQKIMQEPNADKWEMTLFANRRKQVDFYKSQPEFNTFSADFKQFVETNIRYNYWHLLLAHPILRANADATSMRLYSLPSLMTESLDLAKVSDEQALMSETYRHFLYFFVTYFNSKNRQFEKYKNLSAAMTDKATFASKQLKGNVLKYYLTRLLLENCSKTPALAIKQTLEQLEGLPQAKKYVDVATAHCQEAMNKKEEAKPEIASKNGDKSGYDLVGLNDEVFNTSKFKGKYVYVDFWASWCGPCRQEMPYSKAMQEKLTEKQKSKIVFLNISIDERKENWKKAVEQLKLEGENGWSPDIGFKLKITSIPRYMIIDKEGKIINLSAPRPSNPSTIDMLKELIEK